MKLTREQIEEFRDCCISDDTLLRYKHVEMVYAEACGSIAG